MIFLTPLTLVLAMLDALPDDDESAEDSPRLFLSRIILLSHR